MKQINWNDYKTNKEITEAIMDHASSFNLEKMQSDLSKDFVYQEASIRKIYSALCTGSNAILWGPGGFGKSAVAKAICEYMDLPIIYKVGYEGMTAEELLGVPDMNKLLNDSTYKVAFENSVFAKPGILILEEFCDTGAATAAALKDVLTAGGFREGDEITPSLVSTVIITGNKRPEDLAVDDTTKAFYKERFPMRNHVKWEFLQEENYLRFFDVFFKDKYRQNFSEFRLLAKLVVNTEEMVSPRIAAKAGSVMLRLGIDFLDTIEDIDTSELTSMKSEALKEHVLYTEKEMLDNYERHLSEMLVDGSDPKALIRHQVKLNMLLLSIKDEEFSEENFVQFTSVVKNIENLIRINANNFRRFIGDEEDDKIGEEIQKLFTHEN